MNLTNVESILDANTVYQCELKGGCKLFVPFFSDENEENDAKFKQSIADKLDVVIPTETPIIKTESKFDTADKPMIICPHCGHIGIDPYWLKQNSIVCTECNKPVNVAVKVSFTTSI